MFREINCEPFLCLQFLKNWFNIKMLQAEQSWDLTAVLNYQTQLKWINKIYKAADIISSKRTHTERESAVRLTDLISISENQIQWAEHWNSDAMTGKYYLLQSAISELANYFYLGCYLTSLSWEIMWDLISFHLSLLCSYWLHWAQIISLTELKILIWSDVNKWQICLKNKMSGMKQTLISDFCFCLLFCVTACWLTCVQSVEGFLHLLWKLCHIFLQDTALLHCIFSSHSLWAHVVFKSLLFTTFTEQVQAVENTAVKSKHLLLQNALLKIDSAINNLAHSGYMTAMKNWKMLKTRLKILHAEVWDFHHSLQLMTSLLCSSHEQNKQMSILLINCCLTNITF